MVQFYYLLLPMLQECESWQLLKNSLKRICQGWGEFHHSRLMYPSSCTPGTLKKKLDMLWRQSLHLVIARNFKSCATTNMKQTLSMGSHGTSQWTPGYFLHNQILQQSYWWPLLTHDVNMWTFAAYVQLLKSPLSLPAGKLMPLHTPQQFCHFIFFVLAKSSSLFLTISLPGNLN